jgi:hypothetical protein
MEPYISVVSAMLNSVAYIAEEQDATVIPEEAFVPFNFSYLRDLPADEEAKNPFGGHDQSALPALSA